MLYYILRLWIRWSGGYFYGKTYFTGIEQLSSDKPLILACNHPTAFTEPAYIGGATLKARNFLLRGDMFSGGKLTAAFLRSIKCIPIYRAQDGMANLKKNEATLEYCYDLLGKGDNLFILSEGESKLEKRLRPIQKGTARIAFSAYEKHQRADIQVIPIGINYMDANQFGSNVYTHFGVPIPISEYLEDHAKNPRRAVKLLTDRIKKELLKSVIHVKDPADDALADQLLTIAENDGTDRPFPKISNAPSRQFEFVEIINNLNNLESSEKDTIRQSADNYFAQLKHWKIADIGIAQQRYCSWSVFFALLIGTPAYVIGWLASLIPHGIAKNFADKNIQQEKFYGSVRIGMGGGIYFLFQSLLTVIALFSGSWWFLFLALTLQVWSYFSSVWIKYATKWKAAKRVQQIPKEEREQLENNRLQLQQFMQNLKTKTVAVEV